MPNLIQQIINDRLSKLLDDYLYLDEGADLYKFSGFTRGNLQVLSRCGPQARPPQCGMGTMHMNAAVIHEERII